MRYLKINLSETTRIGNLILGAGSSMFVEAEDEEILGGDSGLLATRDSELIASFSLDVEYIKELEISWLLEDDYTVFNIISSYIFDNLDIYNIEEDDSYEADMYRDFLEYEGEVWEPGQQALFPDEVPAITEIDKEGFLSMVRNNSAYMQIIEELIREHMYETIQEQINNEFDADLADFKDDLNNGLKEYFNNVEYFRENDTDTSDFFRLDSDKEFFEKFKDGIEEDDRIYVYTEYDRIGHKTIVCLKIIINGGSPDYAIPVYPEYAVGKQVSIPNANLSGVIVGYDIDEDGIYYDIETPEYDIQTVREEDIEL